MDSFDSIPPEEDRLNPDFPQNNSIKDEFNNNNDEDMKKKFIHLCINKFYLPFQVKEIYYFYLLFY